MLIDARLASARPWAAPSDTAGLALQWSPHSHSLDVFIVFRMSLCAGWAGEVGPLPEAHSAARWLLDWPVEWPSWALGEVKRRWLAAKSFCFVLRTDICWSL